MDGGKGRAQHSDEKKIEMVIVLCFDSINLFTLRTVDWPLLEAQLPEQNYRELAGFHHLGVPWLFGPLCATIRFAS